ncbi:hypothetical protein HKX69_30025 [Streptomyces argyrophyllae]|uniref:Uncharacterized protein n=1 Tax=Streptomyces argyrophylli TaxID=2726118 RepID=A0A6M4PRD4_9ACTN|nr:hypothetical protein [Streptomyces argyrophyllae]QJS13217.1 hypothetical protein HKX69_30025 [Streptomyces argyrophyllae]
MGGFLSTAADWLEFGRPRDGEPLCVHHGPACGLGTAELPEIYRLAVEARRRLGMPAPPLDEHRQAMPVEAARYWREYEDALAAAKACNDQLEAAIRGDDY